MEEAFRLRTDKILKVPTWITLCKPRQTGPPLTFTYLSTVKNRIIFQPSSRERNISVCCCSTPGFISVFIFKRTLNNHVSRTVHDVVAFLFQFGFESGRREGSEPERWPQILLHEPVWEVPGPAAHTLETRGANPQDRYDHRAGMKRVSVESNYNRYNLISLWVGTSEMWL